MITALVAVGALAALVSSASATRLSISNQQFRVTWASLELQPSFGATVRCAVTLEGSFHTRTIVKTAGNLIGYVTHATVKRPCANGEAWAFNGTEVQNGTTLANSLPWHVRYASFAGALPNITALTIGLEGARFLIEELGLRCNYTATGVNGNPQGTARFVGREIEFLRASSGAIASETGGCPTGRFLSQERDGQVFLLGSTTRITVTLI